LVECAAPVNGEFGCNGNKRVSWRTGNGEPSLNPAVVWIFVRQIQFGKLAGFVPYRTGWLEPERFDVGSGILNMIESSLHMYLLPE
jgi:hypothetical protein